MIANALKKKLPRVRKKKIKAALSALLSLIAAPVNNLTTAEIKELFDRVHSAKTGVPADPDIPEKVWAFPKSIRRESKE